MAQARTEPTPAARRVDSTESQREVWAASQLGDEASCAFNEVVVLELAGDLDVQALRAAFQHCVDRHDALRGSFSRDGRAFTMQPALRLELPLVDADDAQLEVMLGDEVATPFDLERGPLLRGRIARLGSSRHVVSITAHQAILDSWSIHALLDETSAVYGAQLAGAEPELEAASSFAEYAAAQAAWEASSAASLAHAYWRRHLEGDIAPLELPTDRPRPHVRSLDSERIDVVLARELVSQLEDLAERFDTSFSIVVLAALSAYLGRVSQQPDVVVGLPVSGQRLAGIPSVGHCTNLLPVRLVPAGSFVDHLLHTRATWADSAAHRRVTFGQLLRTLDIRRDASRVPLVSAVLEVARHPVVRFGPITPILRSQPRRYEPFEMSFRLSDVGGETRLETQYASRLFDRETFAMRMEELLSFTRAVAADPGVDIARAPLLGEARRRWLVSEVNTTARDYPRNECVHDLVLARAARSPDAIAVEDTRGRTLSFAALIDRAWGLARGLRERGVARGDLVGVAVARSVDLATSVLAVHLAGAAYVPLDPAFPAERLAYIVESAKVRIAICDGEPPGALPEDLRYLRLDDERSFVAGEAIDAGTVPDDLAYVIFTSGSTGKPKGVMVHHQAVVNFLWSMADEPGLSEGERLLAITTLSFDIATLELWLPLVVGATCIVADDEVVKDGAALVRALAERRIDVMQATPATWRLMLAAGWTPPLARALCGGEAFPPELLAPLLQRTGELWNMYGPTETTVWSTVDRLTDAAAPITIGRPIANTSVLVLDALGQPVPPGVAGELFIGGDGVSRGYLGRPDLTAERFVDCALSDAPHRLLYRTGDRVCLRRDGRIAFMQRLDHQVKVRGYRIELGEIESVLSQHASVRSSACVVRQWADGDARLLAYYTASDAVSDEALRAHLRAQLPEYMIPSHLGLLDALPLTPNNKVDRKALAALELPDVERREALIAPRNDSERLIAAAVADLIGTERVSMSDNFFEIGGHSLLAFSLIARVREATGLELRPVDVLLEPLGQLAAKLSGETLQQAGAVVARVEPFFFDDLYGAYHAPAGTPRGAVLICQPILLEYMRAHMALRRLATALAASGLAVLRFDYFATGDSSGEAHEGSVERWVDDVRRAARELSARARCDQLSIVGLRFGASLAALACDASLSPAQLVLWDPVVDGHAYLDELRDMHARALLDPLRFAFAARAMRRLRDERHDDEILGYPMPPALARGIAGVDLGRIAPRAGRLLVLRADPGGSTLPNSEARHIADASAWNDIRLVNDALLPLHIPGVIAAELSR